MFLYLSHFAGFRDSLSTEDSDTELLAFDISDSISQYQDSFYTAQPNFLANCYDSSEENTELRSQVSFYSKQTNLLVKYCDPSEERMELQLKHLHEGTVISLTAV
ncbi:hypothetical protein NPIL_60931 [Nephila pilipes]|uniref:Uncharacterized protein n=1 Tax=Nephila pilipes TaxID=299642 RepID=A0A8X6PLK0_NEPPI|nr:hypothetical protein NPIL_60931 [Nephila pilipes]